MRMAALLLCATAFAGCGRAVSESQPAVQQEGRWSFAGDVSTRTATSDPLRVYVSGTVEYRPGALPVVQATCSGTTADCGRISVAIAPDPKGGDHGVAHISVPVSELVERRGECIVWNTSSTGQRTTCREWSTIQEQLQRVLAGGVSAFRVKR